MGETQTMELSREMKVAHIKAKVQRGEYEVDAVAVASAILQRLHAMATAQAERVATSDPRKGPETA